MSPKKISYLPPKAVIVLILIYITLALSIQSEEKKESKLRFVSIKPHINTKGSEFSPTVNATGEIMIFNKKAMGQRYSDLYISIKKDGQWQIARPMTALNSNYSDEAPYLSADGNTLFFSSDRDGSLEMPKNSKGQIKVSYDLYWSKKTGSGWSKPTKVPGQVNSIHHERSPSYDSKRKMLFYSRWPFGDFTKAEIMSAKWNKNKFEAPIKLPKLINAGFMEAGFAPAGNSRGYYFASKRPGGLGGWDIYYTAWKNQQYQPPVNMGPRINSAENDIYLLSRANSVYLCSNRKGSAGQYDIFSTDLEKIIKFRIVNQKTGDPVFLPARISDSRKTKLIHSDKQGKLEASLWKTNDKKIQINIREKGFLPYQKKFDIQNNSIHLIKLVPIEKDKTFIVRNIHFDYNSAKIKTESYSVLNDLVAYLKKNPDLNLEIIGHTDRHASKKYNLRLSLDRANKVRDYFSQKGLDIKRFPIKGAGFENPLNSALTDEADTQNRRTEFRILNSNK